MTANTESGYVISDLHLFAKRSVAARYQHAMHAAAEKADFFVLNGDIFDFCWTTLASIERTMAAACKWLEDLATAHPRCRFIYVLGNHDGLEPFARRLETLCRHVPNLQWHPSYARIGTSLFFHGDIPLGKRRGTIFQRKLARLGSRRGWAIKAGYDLVVATRLHKGVASLHWAPRCSRRIMRMLNTNHSEILHGVTDIYFGHTHRAVSNHHHEGIRFHNTGSTIEGLRCNLLKVSARS